MAPIFLSGKPGGSGVSAGVSSIKEVGGASLTGNVTLSEGANVTLTQVGNNIEIAASGGADLGWYNVKDCGAVGDGVADDTAAIQTCIGAAGAAGGGRVYVPTGTYKLDTAQTSQGALYIAYDNIEIFGDGPSSVLKSTLVSQGVFDCNGCNKVALAPSTAGWYDFRSFFPVGAAVAGATTITTTTAADAGNFSAGDYIWIRTGQYNINSTSQPEAEVNQVVSAVAGTGVITLRWPLGKDYEQQYFITGNDVTTTTASAAATATSVTVTSAAGFAQGDEVSFTGGGGSSHKAVLTNVAGSTLTFADHPVSAGATIANGATVTNSVGETSTGATAYPAVYGVAKVTAVTNVNFYLHDLTLDNVAVNNVAPNMGGGQFVNHKVERVYHVGSGAMISMGAQRWAWVLDCHSRTLAGGFTVSWGPGMGEVIVRGNIFTDELCNQSVAISEGSFNVLIQGNIFSGPSSNSGSHCPIIIGSGSQAVIVSDNIIRNGGDFASGIFVSEFCGPLGGLITGNAIYGDSNLIGITVGSSGWRVENNYFDPAIIGPIQYAEGTSEQPVEALVLSGWVRHDRQNIVLGTVSGRWYVSNVRLYVDEAFNSSGTDQITVGYDANNTAYASAVDVSTTGSKSVTPGFAVNYPDPASTRTVEAYYTAGGTAPNAGKALVVVEYFQVPENQ